MRVRTARLTPSSRALKRELTLYATDDTNPYGSSAIRVWTRKQPLNPVAMKAEYQGKLELPEYQLGEADFTLETELIKSMSARPFSAADLLASGRRTLAQISLRGMEHTKRYETIAAGMRRKNGEYLWRRIQVSSRHCAHLLDPNLFTGPAFDQWSCAGSLAQTMLNERAAMVVEQFEQTVELVRNEIDGEGTWTLGAHQPSSKQFHAFANAAHPQYSKSGFNALEYEFAQALDEVGVGVGRVIPREATDTVSSCL